MNWASPVAVSLLLAVRHAALSSIGRRCLLAAVAAPSSPLSPSVVDAPLLHE